MSGPLVCRCRAQPPALEAAGQSHLARLLPFSPLSFPRKQESSAPKPVTRPWIPACAGMTATERSQNPNEIALLEAGARDKRSFRHGRSLVRTDNRSCTHACLTVYGLTRGDI